MSKRVAACLVALVSFCVIVVSGAVDKYMHAHISSQLFEQTPDPLEGVLQIEANSDIEREIMDPSGEVQTHRKLQQLPLPHSRQPKYSIYTGRTNDSTPLSCSLIL